MARNYVALSVYCPRCSAKPRQSCHRDDGRPMLGVHRERDIEYNRRLAAGGES